MLSCKETARLLTEADEVRLSLGRRIGLCLHLMMCSLCRRYSKQIRLVDTVARGFARRVQDSPPALLGSLSPEGRERMKAALRDE